MPILVFERGNEKGKSIRLEPGKQYVFGRDPAVAIGLTDPLTSRRHFQVQGDGRRFSLADLGSTNGTFLNDEKVKSAELKVGDKIQAGDTIISFLSDQKEETATGLVGKTLGGYKILERVGRGGMGTVYKANQLSLNRIVAFKVLSARLLKDDVFIERFKSEARSAGQLNHPNIVQVYDVGSESGIHFFSMEFMDGGSVQDELGRDGKLGWEDALDLFIQSTRALIFAERKEIIHRDVKPDNLMRTSDGQIKLADLGLARKANGTKTDEEGIFGTPHFISPEQAQGKDVDNRADLYSLGATAYRLLAGRTPFQGSNIKEIITQQITADPLPLKQFAPDTPDEMVAVIEKLMEKVPDERYATAELLLSDLEKIRLKYHLKVTGGGGGKGVIAAVAVAVVAVAAVLVFALAKGKGEGNGNGNVVIAPPPVTTTQKEPIDTGPDPEVIEMRAENAFLKVEKLERPLGILVETALKEKKAWLAVVAEYERVVLEYPGTRAAEKATGRAEKIRATVTEKENAARTARENVGKWWSGVRTKVNELLQEKKFAEALRFAEAAKQDVNLKLAKTVVPDAAEQIDTWNSSSKGSILQRFTTAWSQVKTDVRDLADKGEFAAAAARLREYFDLAIGKEKVGPFAGAVTEAGTIHDQLRETWEGIIRGHLKKDKLLYFQAYLGLRHHADAVGLDPANPVFNFDFAAAAATMEAFQSENGQGLATELFLEVAQRKATQFRAMEKLMATLCARLNDDKLLVSTLDFPLHIQGGKGVKLELNRKKSPVATPTRLEVRKIVTLRGRKAESAESVDWRDFTAGELWEFVFLSGGRFEMTPEDHAAAAWLLAELGVLDGVDDEIAAAGGALTAHQRERLRFEVSAIRMWNDVIEATKSRPEEEWSIAVERFIRDFSRSDWFVLVYGENRAGDHPLIAPARTEAWVAGRLDTLGAKWQPK